MNTCVVCFDCTFVRCQITTPLLEVDSNLTQTRKVTKTCKQQKYIGTITISICKICRHVGIVLLYMYYLENSQLMIMINYI